MKLPEKLELEYEQFISMPEVRAIVLTNNVIVHGALPSLDLVDDETIRGLFLRLSAEQYQNNYEGKTAEFSLG